MHIAKIDFPSFYAETFDLSSGVSSFVKCVRDLPATTSKAKIVIHQAGRLVWLAERTEEYASGRPALQILFYIIATEAVSKIVRAFSGEGESKKHVRISFEEICSDRSRDVLCRAFSNSPSDDFLTLRDAVDYLYDLVK